jgi:stage V sporulation protein G
MAIGYGHSWQRHVVKITEVRIKLIDDKEDRLKAFCAVTFDAEFVVRDLKVIDGPRGLFVAMPSRRMTVRCDACGFRVESRARFCCNCGERQQPESGDMPDGNSRQFADIAHPINGRCRAQIEAAVLAAYASECERFATSGYVDRYGDDGSVS